MTPSPRVSLLLISMGVLSGCATTATTTVAGGSTVSVGVFYDALAPYGEWIYVGNYGRVWRPSVAVVGVGFRPYGPGGRWVLTDYGWSFESDWSWGWAPFHYGRWYLDPFYGWVWVPGSVWAPAWVSWRYGGGYVGWAPLPPAGAAIVVETYHPYWCFVETRYLVVHDVYHYAMPVQSYHAAFNATVTVQQTMGSSGNRWSAGPPAGQVSREIGQPIRTASITPPPPGRVQAHQISVPRASGTAPTAGAAAGPGAARPTAGHPEPARGERAEYPERAERRGDREDRAPSVEHPGESGQRGQSTGEGYGRESHGRPEVPAGRVEPPSHAQPLPPPPPKGKRR